MIWLNVRYCQLFWGPPKCYEQTQAEAGVSRSRSQSQSLLNFRSRSRSLHSFQVRRRSRSQGLKNLESRSHDPKKAGFMKPKPASAHIWLREIISQKTTNPNLSKLNCSSFAEQRRVVNRLPEIVFEIIVPTFQSEQALFRTHPNFNIVDIQKSVQKNRPSINYCV